MPTHIKSMDKNCVHYEIGMDRSSVMFGFPRVLYHIRAVSLFGVIMNIMLSGLGARESALESN